LSRRGGARSRGAFDVGLFQADAGDAGDADATDATDAATARRAQVESGVTLEAAGVILFKHIYRIAPQALPLFSFGKVEGAAVNNALFESAALKAHGKNVVATVATVVGMLSKLDELVPILTKLGKRHVGYGVLPAHYDVVGEALLATISDALGDGFTSEVKEAWTAVYGIVQKTMIGDNYN